MLSEKELESHPITVSEAYHLLTPIKGRFKDTRSQAYKIFKDTYEYVEAYGKIKDKAAAEDLRQSMVDAGCTEEEVAALGTLLPQSVEEARACAPGLSRLDARVLDEIVEKIQGLV